MKLSLRDSRLASVGLASVIAAGVIGVGSVAMAQEGSGDTSTPSTQTTPPAPGEDCLGPGLKLGGRILLHEVGVTREELQQAVAAGLTNGQTIDQYGDKSSAEARADALAALESRLAQAVENGKLTQEKADEILAAAPGKIDEFLAAPAKELGKGMRHGFGGIGQNVLATVAGVLGTDEETLKTQLRDGATIAEIAGDKTQAVIDALVAEASAKIDQAVADGKLTQERADEMKANLADRITRMVNEGGRPFGGGHFGGMRGGMRGFPGQGFRAGSPLPFDAQ
jgi:ribosomal protein S20